MDPRRASLEAMAKALDGHKVIVTFDGDAMHLACGTLTLDGSTIRVQDNPHATTFGLGAVSRMEASYKTWPILRLHKPSDPE